MMRWWWRRKHAAARRPACGGPAGILAALAALALGSPALADHAGKMPWVRSLEEGLALARQSGKPVMIDFSAGW